MWEAVDGRSAYGTLTDSEMDITMLFTFDGYGLIDMVRAEVRGRTVGGVPSLEGYSRVVVRFFLGGSRVGRGWLGILASRGGIVAIMLAVLAGVL